MLRRFLVAIGVLCLFGTAQAQDNLTASEFRDGAIVVFENAHPSWTFRAKGEDAIAYFRNDTSSDDELEGTIFLGYAYSRYLDDPELGFEHVSNMVDTLPFTTDEPSNILERVVLLLRPKDVLESTPPDAGPMATVEFSGDLVGMFALDSETALSYLPEKSLIDQGITIEDARDAAGQNLTARRGEVFIVPHESLLIMETENGLAAGLPLQPGFCDAPEHNHAWWLMDRGTIVLAPISGEDNSKAALDLLIQIFSNAVSARQAYSETIFLCEAGTTQILSLPAS